MRKYGLIVLVLLAAMLLCGCTRLPEVVYTDTVDGVTYTVDTGAKTVTDGTHTYPFTWDQLGDDYVASVTYPNGIVFRWSNNSIGQTDNGRHIPAEYPKGNVLRGMITAAYASGKPVETESEWFDQTMAWVYGLAALAGGMAMAMYPQRMAFWRRRWMYRESTLTDTGVLMYQLGGTVLAVIAVIYLMMLTVESFGG